MPRNLNSVELIWIADVQSHSPFAADQETNLFTENRAADVKHLLDKLRVPLLRCRAKRDCGAVETATLFSTPNKREYDYIISQGWRWWHGG
jgi:hypothetical protein